MKGKTGAHKGERKKTSVVRLADLAPRQNIVSGAGKLVFGVGMGGERGVPDRAPRGIRSKGDLKRRE